MTQLTPKKAEKLFAGYLQESGYNEKTIRWKMHYAGFFLEYLQRRKKTVDLRDITAGRLRYFLTYLG